jgi:hypothetical protein
MNFLLAGSRDFPVPCSRAGIAETWNWRLESRLYPPTRMSTLRECQATVTRVSDPQPPFHGRLLVTRRILSHSRFMGSG